MINKKNFEDYELLEDIRKKLWTADGKSRVSIMVGAGFSRNATKIDDSLPSMALWDNLRIDLLHALGDKEKYKDMTVLELGDVYEERFGIISLENLLKTKIPDENYEPNTLFADLLSLPFSDIYTTNYDTLLERASKNIFTRQYQIIHDIHDIPGSTSPRIVKLHGSFPSNRPFVFSQKSYNEYPTKSAPFVNMVQQSIMETTMILIGFSGDDPNFKNWIEWVSNALGDHRPKIFMLGLNINKSLKFLSQKNITVLDFKNIFKDSTSKYPEFFKELFEFFSDNPKIDERRWPHTNYPWANQSNPNSKDLIALLENNRKTYPGWLIMPSKISNRQLMPQIIDNYFIRLKNENDTSIKENLAFELVWLLKNYRIPISKYQQASLEALIINASNYNHNIIDIILFLIREYRLDGNDVFLKYAELLSNKQLNSSQKNELSYQKILWYQDSLSDKKIKEQVDSWKNDTQSLDFLIKKACILFSIDESDEALSILKHVLQTARQIQSISANNFFARSVEGVVLTLLQKYENQYYNENYFNRLIELDQNFCSPSTTIEYISNFKREKIPNAVERTKDFDGKTIVSHYMGNYGISDLADAFFLMTLHDDYGIGIDENHRLDILKYLFKYYPKYSQKKVFYFAEQKELNVFFSKEQIYNLKREQIDSLYLFLTNALKNKSTKNISMVLDGLFRLYFILNKAQRINLEESLLTLYSSNNIWTLLQINARKIFSTCFSRVLHEKHGKDLEIFINRLFNLPMVGESGTNLESIKLDNYFTFEPLQIVNENDIKIDNIVITSSTYTLNKILTYLKNKSLPISVRLASWNRLLVLKESSTLNILEHPEVRELAKSMLSNNDEIFQTYLKSYAVTQLVNEKSFSIYYLKELMNTPFNESFSSTSAAIGTNLQTQLNEFRNLLTKTTYDQKIYTKLVINIEIWWSSQYKLCKKYETDTLFSHISDLAAMIVFIKEAILKKINKQFFTPQMKQILSNCYSDLKSDDDSRAMLLLPGILKITTSFSENLLPLFKNNILSADKTNIENAAYLIQDVAFYKDRNELELNIRELKIILLQLFAVQKESSLPAVSRTISLILENSKKFFTKKEKETLGINVDQFFSSYLSIDNQTVFKQDIFNEILINYLDIITKLRNERINVKLDQWIHFCARSKYSEINRYESILKVTANATLDK